MDIGLSTRALGGQKPPDLTALGAIKTPDDFIKQIGSKPYVSGLPPRWFYKNNGVPTEVPSDIADMLSKSNYNPMRQSKVTKTSRNLYHTTPRANLESIAKEGLVTGKTPTIGGGDTQARISSSKKTSFGANEATASYYGGNDAVMLRTKTGYDPGDLELDLLAGGEGTYTTGKNIPPEMLEVKINGKWQPLKPPDPLEALKVEARKYKSEEEFVKAQGEPLYHGVSSSRKFNGYKKAPKTMSFGEEGVYLTPDRQTADMFGEGGVIEGVIDKNTKIKDLTNAKENLSGVDFQKEVSKAKKEGFDGVKTRLQVLVFDEKKLKTKSQLTDIYNQSQLPKSIVDPLVMGATPPNLKQPNQPKLPDELQLPPSAKPKNKAFSNVK